MVDAVTGRKRCARRLLAHAVTAEPRSMPRGLIQSGNRSHGRPIQLGAVQSAKARLAKVDRFPPATFETGVATEGTHDRAASVARAKEQKNARVAARLARNVAAQPESWWPTKTSQDKAPVSVQKQLLEQLGVAD